MAKEAGMAWTTCSVDVSGGGATVIKNDITNLNFSLTRGVFDWTGIDKSAHERGLGLGDFSISLTGVFNDSATSLWEVMKTICSTTVMRTVALAISGQTLNNEVAFDSAAHARSADGSFLITATGNLSDGTAPTWS